MRQVRANENARKNQRPPALRFRSSQAFAAPLMRTSESRELQQLMNSSAANLKFLRSRGRRNFKFKAALDDPGRRSNGEGDGAFPCLAGWLSAYGNQDP